MLHLQPRRDFNPKKSPRYGRPAFPPDKLVKYSPKWGFSRMFNFPFTGSHWRPRMHTVVIAVDGASKPNSRTDPRTQGGYGVYFGSNCKHNSCGRFAGTEQTAPYAELEAVKVALETVMIMQASGVFQSFHFNEIILKTNSTYVHHTFNMWIWDYVINGYKLSNGKPTAHSGMISKIHNIICTMERSLNMAVRFWLVDKSWNTDAHGLASLAIQETSADDANGGHESRGV